MAVSLSEFQKFNIRVGTIISAERISGSEKLLKLLVDIGEEDKIQIIAGIGTFASPEDLTGLQSVFLVNLEPRNIMGLQSNGMLLAASDEQEGLALLIPSTRMPAGSKVR